MKSGSACICTIPLGVLMGSGDQEGDIVFEPKLSAEKQIAIRTRGMAYTNYSLMKFSTPFWREVDPGMTSWQYVTSRGMQCDRALGEDFKFFSNWFEVGTTDEHFYLGSFWEGDQYWAEALTDLELGKKFAKSLER